VVVGHLHVVSDGRRVTLRRAQQRDRPAIVSLYENLSPTSWYYRFHHPTPRLNGQLRELLTDLDRADVWLAFDGDVCVGEARLAGYRDRADHADWADLAVTVADDYQHNGVGRHLAWLAISHDGGRHRSIAITTLAENTAAVRMARRAAIDLRFDGSVLEGQIPNRPRLEESTMPKQRKHDPKLDRLAEIALFRGCTRRQLQELAGLTTEMDVARGAVLCREGYTGTECFVVRCGEVSVTIAGDEVATIGSGGFFGELALLDGEPRVATVTAATDLSVVVLSRSDFDQMLTRLPRISRRILEAVAARLRAVDYRLLDARLSA
jgi:CRP/FNR family transcriptional regulator, cyclic AMP receptor protein